ncbi:MAG: hypothetical protein ACYTFG_17875 [Planctomycetota bacterium]|jgi:hypothetical protein
MIKQITKEKVSQFSGNANFVKVNDKEFHWTREYSTIIKKIEGNTETFFVKSDKLSENENPAILTPLGLKTGKEYTNENTKDFVPDFDYEADDNLEN